MTPAKPLLLFLCIFSMLLLTDCKNKDIRGTKPQRTPQDTAADKRSSSQTTSNPARSEPGDQDREQKAPLMPAQKGQIKAALEGASKLLQAFPNNSQDKQRLEDAITNAQDWEGLRSQCGGLHWQKKSAFQRLLKQLEAMSKGPLDRRLIASIEDPELSRAQLLVVTFSGKEDADRDRLLAGLRYAVGSKDSPAPAKDEASEKAFLRLQALIQTL